MASTYSDVAMDAALLEVRGVLLELEGEAVAVLDGAGLNYEGDTRQSMYSEAERRGDSVFGAFGAGADHAIFAHEGRGPGKAPPISKIQPWVERKLGIPAPESRRVAYLTARKIGRKGTEGTPFLRQPFELKRPEIGPRVARRVAQALDSRVP